MNLDIANGFAALIVSVISIAGTVVFLVARSVSQQHKVEQLQESVREIVKTLTIYKDDSKREYERLEDKLDTFQGLLHTIASGMARIEGEMKSHQYDHYNQSRQKREQ